MSRTSPAVFNSRHEPWGARDQVIVYNCKSDTKALGFEDDIVLSTTYFKTKPWIFSIIYGYPNDMLPFLMEDLEKFKMFAFQPLMMPMVFADFERQRLMRRWEIYDNKLKQRQLEFRNALKNDKEEAQKREKNQIPQKRDSSFVAHIRASFLANLQSIKKEVSHRWKYGTKTSSLEYKEGSGSSHSDPGGGNPKAEERTAREALITAAGKDDNNTDVLRDVNRLIVGLECFRKVLFAMQGQTDTIQHSELQPQINVNEAEASRRSGGIISGLRDMNADIENTIMASQGLLTMSERVSQVEWNYYSRRDAADNFIIAQASKEDSAQMKVISLVGMIFLPGTFLATFFSMTFFRWMPDNSSEVVSPYLGIYAGLTVIFTIGTLVYWQQQQRIARKDDEDIRRKSRSMTMQVLPR